MSLHIYHYNVNAEQRYFLDRERDLYDLIALNGNIVSHTPAGVAAFLANAGKEFYIDPQTHAFQHATIHLKRDTANREEGEPPILEFKPSIAKLAKERLGSPFARVIEKDRPLSPDDFKAADGNWDAGSITKTCERVVGFQTEAMIQSLDDEAKEFMGDQTDFRPKFIVSPYFYLSPRFYRDWLDLTIYCYRVTKLMVPESPVYLSLVVSKEALDDGIDHIVTSVNKSKPDGILLWIDEHEEEKISIREIERYIRLLQGLRNSTETLYNSHGGYLSILLCHHGANALLSGVGHSINYGEHRSVVPIGGGIPLARFYYPSIHSRIRFGDALGIVLSKKWLTSMETYRGYVCRCVQCTELLTSKKSIDEAFQVYGESNPVTFRRRSGSIVGLEYPAKEAKQAAARHYLYNKANEFREIRTRELAELLSDLKKTYYEIFPYSGDQLVAHLLNWEGSLRSFVE
jgi:hypothetical protein